MATPATASTVRWPFENPLMRVVTRSRSWATTFFTSAAELRSAGAGVGLVATGGVAVRSTAGSVVVIRSASS